MVAIVQGVASNDMLNVRKDPSPGGAVLTRLTNGAMVRRLRCDMVKGYEWCEIEAFEQGGVRGWTPSRYLLSGEAEGRQEVAALPPANQVIDSNASSNDMADAGKLPVPDDLSARIGDASESVVSPDAKQRAASIEAAATALTLALVGADASAAPETSPGSSDAAAPEKAISANASAEAPIAEAALHPFDGDATAGTDQIPCARYLGQPMTVCRMKVERKEDGAADLTVFWPDGGSRVIVFRAGKPDGSDGEGELTYVREAQLNMIRVGTAERFEILDRLALGN